MGLAQLALEVITSEAAKGDRFAQDALEHIRSGCGALLSLGVARHCSISGQFACSGCCNCRVVEAPAHTYDTVVIGPKVVVECMGRRKTLD